MIDHTGFSRIVESGGCVRACDVVADFAEILRPQWLSGGSGKKAEVDTQRGGGLVRKTVRVQAQIRRSWVRGELDIHEELITAEQAVAVVERGIDSRLDVLHRLVQFGRCQQVRIGNVGAHAADRHPLVASQMEAANAIGGRTLRVRVAVGVDYGRTAVLRRQATK